MAGQRPFRDAKDYQYSTPTPELAFPDLPADHPLNGQSAGLPPFMGSGTLPSSPIANLPASLPLPGATGGSGFLSTILGMADQFGGWNELGQVLGAQAGGAAEGRKSEAEIANEINRTMVQKYGLDLGDSANKDRTLADIFGVQQSAVTNRDRSLTDIFGTQQGAATDADRTAADVYGTKQGATTAADKLRTDQWDLANQNVLDAGKMDLDRRQFGLDATDARTRQAIMGGLMGNMQDVGVNASPNIPLTTFTGGARPSAIGSTARSFGDLMGSQALAAQQKGDVFDPLALKDAPGISALVNSPTPSSPITAPTLGDPLKPPELSARPDQPDLMEMPQAGFMDKLQGGGAQGAQLIDILSRFLKKKPAAAGTPPLAPPATPERDIDFV